MENIEDLRDASSSNSIESEETVETDSDKTELTCDRILEEIGGFGPYQILVGIATGIALLLSSFSLMNFIFASGIPEHRCWIPECELSDTRDFHANWTKFTIPVKNGVMDSCSRYAYIPPDTEDLCTEASFNQSEIIPCDGFVIKNHEERLIDRLNFLCTAREKNLPLIGTASTTGKAAGILLTGLLSDKLGRLLTFVGCLMLSSIMGCLQTLPAPYMTFELYALLEFLSAFATSGVLGATCTFNMEWATANRRAHLNTIASFMDSFHPVFIGLAAWYFEENFVKYKLSLALSGFAIISIYFVLTDPPQWLLARQKYTRLVESIENAAKINGRSPSADLIEQIQNQPPPTEDTAHQEHSEDHGRRVTFRALFKEKVLVLRLVVISLVKLCVTFAYYGNMLSSTNVHDNKYLSYALIGSAEVPGALIALIVLNRLGRRMTIGSSLLVYGTLMIASSQLSADLSDIQLILFCICRAILKGSSLVLFIYALELWPTAVRNRAFNIGSLFGRIGAILATLSVMLMEYHKQLPLFVNGCATIVAAVLLFVFLPETMHCGKLPDTIDEALAIGRRDDGQPERRDAI